MEVSRVDERYQFPRNQRLCVGKQVGQCRFCLEDIDSQYNQERLRVFVQAQYHGLFSFACRRKD